MKRRKGPSIGLQRGIVLGILFIIQIVWFFVVFSELVINSIWLEYALTLLSLMMVLFLVVKDENPAYRQSWIILIFAVPVFGGLLYLIMGNKRPAKKMTRAIQEQTSKHRRDMTCTEDVTPALAEKNPRLASLSRYLDQVGGAPLYQDNTVQYYPSGESMMDDLIRDLKRAKKSIFIEFFIIEYGMMYDQIFDVLKERAQAGVDVRLIYDDFGTLTRLPLDYEEQLKKEGIKALRFNPVKPILSLLYNTRDHRKFIIIDGSIAYTGGVNIADEYINEVERFGYWKDTMIRVAGDGVWNYTYLFLNMWNAFKPTDDDYLVFKPELVESDEAFDEYLTGGFVQPFGDTPLDNEPVGKNVYRDMISAATDYVYIYTPYLVISYELQTALTLAAQRGVDVRIMTPGIPDKKTVFRMTRSFYRPLLEAGVKIYEYTPGFLHAKMMVCDDIVANVGTINFDYRSLYLHFETSTVLYYHPVIKVIKNDFLMSQAVSTEVKLGNIRQSYPGRVWDAILRLLAPFA